MRSMAVLQLLRDFAAASGDTANGGRQAYATIKRFAETGASEVVSWCPTCMVQMGETALPVYEEQEGAAGFDMSMMAVFLERHLDRLQKCSSIQ